MEPQSEQLRREAEEARWQLSETLEELRGRMTPGRVVDQVIDYTRDSPVGDFLHNLGREVRENPMPLILIGIGIGWLMVASSRTSRAAIAGATDTVARRAEHISMTASTAVGRTSEWCQQTATRLADRASNVASAIGNQTASLADRARSVTDGLTEKARSTSAVAVVTLEKAKGPLAGARKEGDGSEVGQDLANSGRAVVSGAAFDEDAPTEEPARERR
jgi:hypothetical protein